MEDIRVAPDRDEPSMNRGDVDRTLLRENLKLSVTERVRKHRKIAEFVEKLRLAGQRARDEQ